MKVELPEVTLEFAQDQARVRLLVDPWHRRYVVISLPVFAEQFTERYRLFRERNPDVPAEALQALALTSLGKTQAEMDELRASGRSWVSPEDREREAVKARMAQ